MKQSDSYLFPFLTLLLLGAVPPSRAELPSVQLEQLQSSEIAPGYELVAPFVSGRVPYIMLRHRCREELIVHSAVTHQLAHRAAFPRQPGSEFFGVAVPGEGTEPVGWGISGDYRFATFAPFGSTLIDAKVPIHWKFLGTYEVGDTERVLFAERNGSVRLWHFDFSSGRTARLGRQQAGTSPTSYVELVSFANSPVAVIEDKNGFSFLDLLTNKIIEKREFPHTTGIFPTMLASAGPKLALHVAPREILVYETPNAVPIYYGIYESDLNSAQYFEDEEIPYLILPVPDRDGFSDKVINLSTSGGQVMSFPQRATVTPLHSIEPATLIPLGNQTIGVSVSLTGIITVFHPASGTILGNYDLKLGGKEKCTGQPAIIPSNGFYFLVGTTTSLQGDGNRLYTVRLEINPY